MCFLLFNFTPVFLWLEQELTAENFFVPWNYTKKERKGERELTLTAVSTETTGKKEFHVRVHPEGMSSKL